MWWTHGARGSVTQRCDNCGAPLDGSYCARCGQSVGTLDVPVTEFARDFASEALGLDSRVRMTLWPLVRYPGRVAAEYVAGHRARFVPPIRLYLLSSFVMFVVLSFGEFQVDNVEVDGRRIDSTGQVEEGSETGRSFTADLGSDELNERLADGFERLVEDPSAITDIYVDRLARVMIVLLPVSAVLLKLMWWRRWFVHHMVFAMYLHSFAFLLLSVTTLPSVLGLGGLSRIFEPLVLVIPIHFFLALRRFYGRGWASYPKGLFVLVAYTALTSVAVMLLLLSSVLAL